MIFYFSGTVNSLHVAKMISLSQGEQLIYIAKEFDNIAAVTIPNF